MADFEMCDDHGCPMRSGCYRYRAVPSELQWFGRYRDKRTATSCPGFEFVGERRDIRTLKDIALEQLRLREAVQLEG